MFKRFSLIALLMLFVAGGSDCPSGPAEQGVPMQMDGTDLDGDGLSDDFELSISLNPFDHDTDGDGLTDGDEFKVTGTSPTDSDTDDDMLQDGDEVSTYGTNPLIDDTDCDGLKDGTEALYFESDPLRSDTDEDTIDDGDEIELGLNLLEANEIGSIVQVICPLSIEVDSPNGCGIYMASFDFASTQPAQPGDSVVFMTTKANSSDPTGFVGANLTTWERCSYQWSGERESIAGTITGAQNELFPINGIDLAIDGNFALRISDAFSHVLSWKNGDRVITIGPAIPDNQNIKPKVLNLRTCETATVLGGL